LFFGTKIMGGWVLVGRFRCLCGKHSLDPYAFVWKKGDSYVIQRGEGEHLIHPIHSTYDPTHWRIELTNIWEELLGHDIEVESMARPPYVRHRLPRPK
jgi:hypothetical protein